MTSTNESEAVAVAVPKRELVDVEADISDLESKLEAAKREKAAIHEDMKARSLEPVKLGHFGLGTQKFNAEGMDPANDIYPVPLVSSRRLFCKVTGFDRLMFPVFYLQIDRFEEVLREQVEKKDDDPSMVLYDHTKPYRTTFFGHLCAGNHVSNLSYTHNRAQYDTIMAVALRTLKPAQLEKLLNMCITNTMAWDENELQYMLRDLHARPHYLVALCYFGLKIPKEMLSYLQDDPLRLQLTAGGGTIPRPKPGQQCPITLAPMRIPTFLSDGTCYELSAIAEHIKKANTSPVTGLKLAHKSLFVTRPILQFLHCD